MWRFRVSWLRTVVRVEVEPADRLYVEIRNAKRRAGISIVSGPCQQQTKRLPCQLLNRAPALDE